MAQGQADVARLDEEHEQALLDVVYNKLGDIVEASSGPLKDWLRRSKRELQL